LVFLMSGLAHEIIVTGYMCGAAEEQRRLAAAAAAGSKGWWWRRLGWGGGGQQHYYRAPGLMMVFFLAQVPALLLEQRAHDMRQQRRAAPAGANGLATAAPPAGAVAKRPGTDRTAVAPLLLPLLARVLRSAFTLLCLLLMTHFVGFFAAMEACGVDGAGIEEVGLAIDAAAVRLRAN
jgi:hypothetical protein